MKALVLLGGGHAHIEVLRAFALQPIEGWRLTLVSPFVSQIYSGMVPGVIAGHYTVDDCAIDLRTLCAKAGATFLQTRASLVDAARREVVLADGGTARYDLLSLDIGGSPAIGKARGVAEHATLIRPLEKAIQKWPEVVERARARDGYSITLVGAGAAGIELALAMDHRLRNDPQVHAPHVRVIGDAEPMQEIPRAARELLLRRVHRRGIGVHAGNGVVEVGEDFVQLGGGLQFASDATFWTTGVAAPELVRDSGFATDDRGFLLTNAFLQSTSHADVFGAGDCATQREHARPKAGVFAVRAAPILAANLRAAMTGTALQPFKTSRRYLALISTGERHAVGFWNGFVFDGAWTWRWKDRIDRRFIAKYDAASA